LADLSLKDSTETTKIMILGNSVEMEMDSEDSVEDSVDLEEMGISLVDVFGVLYFYFVYFSYNKSDKFYYKIIIKCKNLIF
jgi:hypothetical protein